MTGPLLTATGDVVDALVDAGVHATADPRNLRPPAVLVTPETLSPAGGCAVDVVVSVVVVTLGPANLDALTVLDGLVAATLAALGPSEAKLVGVESPQTGETLPGYQLEYTRTVALT